MSSVVNPHDIHRRPTSFGECHISRNTASLAKKGIETGQNEERDCQTSKILQQETVLYAIQVLSFKKEDESHNHTE